MLRSLINQRLGRYLVTAQLGRGGMAAVYRATDTMLQREVAIKVLYAHYADDASLVERFKREAVTAAALEHPHIVPIYDVGEQDGMVYIAMKLLTGRSLADVLGERGTLSLAEVLLVLEPVAAALDYAHSKGVIHRDIKPGNILLDGDTSPGQPLDGNTRVMLTDFGIAKTLDTPGMTTTGALIGTPDYMAPEQIGNQNVDRRVDVYALGMVAFRALTGRQAFEGTTQDVLVGHLYGTVPAPSSLNRSLGPALDSAIVRALSRDPNGRFPSAGALVAALKQPASSSDMPTQVGAPPVRPQPDPARPATVSGTAPPLSRPPTAAPRTVTTAQQRVAAQPSPAPARRPEPQRATWILWLLVAMLVATVALLGMVAVGAFNGGTSTGSVPTASVNQPGETVVPPALTDTPSPTATEAITATATITATAEVTATATAEAAPTAVPTTPPAPTAPPLVQPTLTPRPTDTTVPPTPTNTPAPTATPTAAPLACRIQLQRGFKNIFDNFPAVQQKLGCPTDNEIPTEGAIQLFERGAMIWYRESDLHYVFFSINRGAYQVFNRDQVNLLPIPTPQPTGSPTDPNAPGGGFAQIYYNNAEIREKLGNPTTKPRGMDPNQGLNGSYQFFAGGAMLFTPFYGGEAKTIFVVYNTDNTFERYQDTTP